MSAPRVLLTCVAEDNAGFRTRVETLVDSVSALGGPLAECPMVVNMVGSVDAAFASRMEAAGVEVRIVERVVHGGVAHVNKLRMLELHERKDFDVLLAIDCDIVVARDPLPHLPTHAVGAVPADLDPFTESQWRGIFAGLETDPGPRSVVATTTGKPMYAYFNSGVIAVPRPMCADLFDGWMQALRDLDALWLREPGLIPRAKRFYTDQLGLSVALWRGLPHTPVTRELNFATHVPLHKPTVDGLRPVLLHYHAEVDDAGFLLRPRCPVAEPAAERVNRLRAQALDLPYTGLRARPLGDRARRFSQRWSEKVQRRLRTQRRGAA